MAKPWEKYKKQSGPWDKYTPEDSGPMGFVNKGIAGALGAPVDVTTAAVNLIPGVDIQNPIGGSESIRRAMGASGIQTPDREPRTVSEHAGDVVGQSAAMMAAGAGVVNLAAKGLGLVGKSDLIKNISNNIIKTASRHPYMTMASELTGGVGAGIGRGQAEVQNLEDPTANLYEIGGGIAGAVTPSAMVHTPAMLAFRTGKNLFYKFSSPFSKAGSKYRASEYIHGLTSDTKGAVKAIGEKNISDLPPALQSGEKRLSALYKSLVSLDPVEESQAVDKVGKSIIKLEKEMRSLGYGSPEILEEVTQKRLAAIELGMDRRVTSALKNAQKKLDRVPVAKKQSAESVVVNNELRNLLSNERAIERKMWSDVPKDHRVGFEETKAVYKNIADDLSTAQAEDIPSILNKSFITDSKNKSLKTTVREMTGLRSKLLERERIARSNKEWNKARIANNVADAILEDLGVHAELADGSVGTVLKAALAQSRKIHDRFNSGVVGKILGKGRDGAPSIDPTLTLDVSVGRGGLRGAVDIEKVAPTEAARRATERYLARSFTDYSSGADGVLNTVKSKRWLSNNEEILEQFPQLRKQLDDADSAQKIADATSKKMNDRKVALRDPKVSASAKFLNRADIGQEISYIFKSKSPKLTMRELTRQASKDASGDAIGGLRAGVVEHILGNASVGPYNEIGQRTLSGRSILGFIRNNKPALYEVFSKKQIGKMRRVGIELAKIEQYEKMRPGGPIELKDPASSALRLFARIAGARVGGIMGRESAGGSLQMAQITSGRFQQFIGFLTKNRAEGLIQDAILSDDPTLLKSLLAPIGGRSKSARANMKRLNTKMNAWLAGTGARVFEDIQNEIKETENS